MRASELASAEDEGKDIHDERRPGVAARESDVDDEGNPAVVEGGL